MISLNLLNINVETTIRHSFHHIFNIYKYMILLLYTNSYGGYGGYGGYIIRLIEKGI